MARRRIIERVVTGAQTILGRLAQWFGLGQSGSIQQPLQPQPGRQELETPQQIIEAIAAERLTPTAQEGNRVSRSYLCTWTEVETGNVVGKSRIQVETSEGQAAIVATTKARQDAQSKLPGCVIAAIGAGMHLRMTCRQLGRALLIPASE